MSTKSDALRKMYRKFCRERGCNLSAEQVYDDGTTSHACPPFCPQVKQSVRDTLSLLKEESTGPGSATTKERIERLETDKEINELGEYYRRMGKLVVGIHELQCRLVKLVNAEGKGVSNYVRGALGSDALSLLKDTGPRPKEDKE